MDRFGPLVDADWLLAHQGDPDLRLVDFRWRLGGSGRAGYEAGHLPGAVFVDLDGDVSGHGPGAGRHPLPEPEAFERVMRQAGVSDASRVVVYDDQGGIYAARLWWLLRYFGHDAVAVLDGGLQAWPGPLSAEPVDPAQGDLLARAPRESWKLDYDEVRALGEGVLLLDARAPERYRGEEEPIDPRPGHIPGARSAPTRGNLDDRLRFLPAEDLRRRYEAVGVRDGAQVVAYCGSGVTACHDLLGLELAGLPGARLYAGSWSDWSSRPEAPAATGEEPLTTDGAVP